MYTLIGHTGFIGSYLSSVESPGKTYNSKNIESIRDTEHDLIICAGINAVKWKANREPDLDWINIEKLWDSVKRTNAKRFVLISTVDVYPNPVGVDESNDPIMLPNHSYGLHRLAFEEMIKSRFNHHHIIRLPALYGPGLKKNILFDMINNNQIEQINPNSSFQWYGLNRLWNDITTVINNDIKTINMAVEPIETCLIRDTLFPNLVLQPNLNNKVSYDVRTLHGNYFGRNSNYLESAENCLVRMNKWRNSINLNE